MKVSYRGKRQHGKRQLHISTWQEPNFFEKWFMAKSAMVVNYVGTGDKWFVMQLGDVNPLDFTPVTDKVLLQWLQDIESGKLKTLKS